MTGAAANAIETICPILTVRRPAVVDELSHGGADGRCASPDEEQIQNTLARAIRELQGHVQLAIGQVTVNSGQSTAMLTRKR
jgi:hypothetical protein